MDLRLEEIDTLAQARPGWDDLAEASGNVLSPWDWADTWGGTSALGRGSCRAARAWSTAWVVAILPLYKARLRVLIRAWRPSPWAAGASPR